MGHTRKVPRYPFGQEAMLHPAGGSVGSHATIREISTKGCELQCSFGPNVGKGCELYFEWEGTYIGLQAQVVWKREAQGRMGLKFRSVDKESQRRLNVLCGALSTRKSSGPPLGHLEEPQPVATGMTAPLDSHPAFPLKAAPAARLSAERSRRGVPRYASELQGHLVDAATGAKTDVLLVELSLTGGRLQGNQLPEAQQTYELHTEGEGKRLIIRGEIVWKTSHEVGFKFSSPDEETVRNLRQICSNLRLLPPPPSL